MDRAGKDFTYRHTLKLFPPDRDDVLVTLMDYLLLAN